MLLPTTKQTDAKKQMPPPTTKQTDAKTKTPSAIPKQTTEKPPSTMDAKKQAELRLSGHLNLIEQVRQSRR